MRNLDVKDNAAWLVCLKCRYLRAEHWGRKLRCPVTKDSSFFADLSAEGATRAELERLLASCRTAALGAKIDDLDYSGLKRALSEMREHLIREHSYAGVELSTYGLSRLNFIVQVRRRWRGSQQ